MPTAAKPAEDWRVNNFDLIRLLAALQVAAVHTISLFKLTGVTVTVVNGVLRMFPGVPIFFLISGCLISKSFERSVSIRDFYRNRLLRIYPGLWICLVLSIAAIAIKIATVPHFGPVSRSEMLTWWAAQMASYQQYSPRFLHNTRVNGSLWTIPPELEFYALLPLLYAVLRLRERRGDFALIVISICSSAFHWMIMHASQGSALANNRWLIESVLPFLWIFLSGVLIQRHWSSLRKYLAGRAHWWILGYLLFSAVMRQQFYILVGSAEFHFLFLLPLAGVVMSCAVTWPGLSDKVLAHQDISYGTYIYHVMIIDAMLELGVRPDAPHALAALAMSAAVGALSWLCVERPFLRRKHHALRSSP
jgi:peptidoglycan/LPS O-acetylase OafA/YrhL